MRNLDGVVRSLMTHFDKVDAARETALASSRDVVRASGSAIKAVHRRLDPEPALATAEKALKKLKKAVKGRPEIEGAGFVTQAYQEFAEAHFVRAVAAGESLPRPNALGVPPDGYLLGLGDLVGELRRMALDEMLRGEVDAAAGRLDQMEDLYMALMRFDYPSALVDVRRKQDAARGMLERTRGEIAVAVRGKRMEDKIDRLSDMLDELEEDGAPSAAKRAAAKRARKSDEDDLPDLDGID